MARRVVLADDSETIRKVVELVLEPEGFSVESYRDGEQAMRAITAQPPDLVLADVDLPQLSGVLLCRSLKDNDDTSSVPVILLVGAFEPFDEDAVRLSGADDIIVKPFESKELVSKTKALLGRPRTASAPLSPAVTSVQDTAQDEEASLDEELARQWELAAEEPLKPSPPEKTGPGEPTPDISHAVELPLDAALPEASLTDEELAKQWAAAMGEGDLEQNPASNADAGPSVIAVELPDDDLARQWEASLLEGAGETIEVAGEHASAGLPERSSFSDLLSAEMDVSVQAELSSGAEMNEEPTGRAKSASQNITQPGSISRDEIREMVRVAVDEALAELLQSERSRIQKEFENTVRKTVKNVAEAILLRELDKSVSAE